MLTLVEGSLHESSSPEFVMNVSDLVSDGDGSLSRCMTISNVQHDHKGAKWINRVASEFGFQPFIDTLASCCTMSMWEEPNLHPELYWRDITDRMLLLWKLPVLTCLFFSSLFFEARWWCGGWCGTARLTSTHRALRPNQLHWTLSFRCP